MNVNLITPLSFPDGHSVSLLWEVVTVGATPYPGVRTTELYTNLATGYRMEKPLQCPQELYMLMLDTWMAHPDQRPGFQEIHERINRIIRHSTLVSCCYGHTTVGSTDRKLEFVKNCLLLRNENNIINMLGSYLLCIREIAKGELHYICI